MQIESSQLGTVEIDKDKIVNFPDGLPGFEDNKKYVVIPMGEENPFYFLQSVDEADLCFIVTEPYLFFKDYEINLDKEFIKELELDSEEDVAVYGIITLKEELKTATVNLQAPIVVNSKKLIGKQYIADDNNYLTKQPLFPAKDK